MSAYLDKSQGITFVYSNIFDIYKRAKEAKIDAPFVAERKVIKAKDANPKQFVPAELKAPEGERTFTVPMGVREAEEKRKISKVDLKKNLSELTEAHERLRFILQELDSLTKKK